MAKVEDMANELVLAKEQLKNINATINRDKEVLAGIEKEIKIKEWLCKEAQDKIDSLVDEIASINANKESAEKEYWAVRDNLKAEIKKLSDSKKRDEEKYHISISELSNDVKVYSERKSELLNSIGDLEKELREAKDKANSEIAAKENEIRKVQGELDDIKVKFAEQESRFNKVEWEIKVMEEKLAENAKLDKAIEKAKKNLEEEMARIEDAKAEKAEIEKSVKSNKALIKEMEKLNENLAKENENYVKQKIDIKERNDKLDAREKYLRKRFEEAWVKFD